MSDLDDKKALYKQIVESTDDAMLLERMRELGFWAWDESIPEDPPEEWKERNELEYEIARLRKKSAVVGDPDKALQKERVRRWNESKNRRAKAKIERDIAAKERREKWEAEKAERVWTAGDGVSGGLEQHPTKDQGEWRFGVPEIRTPKELATAMGISIGQLRWLTYHRRASALVHYHRYGIPKKTGGVRHISAPKRKLARAQEWILVHVLEKVPVHDKAHGFVRGRNVKSNALPHSKKRVVVNLDLKDFFPSLGFRRVKGLFHKALGYPEPVAVVMALICTEPPRVEAELDGKVYRVALGERVLPQGACTSPAITNVVCRTLDKRLAGLAEQSGFAYTRYADDLTFSGSDRGAVGKLLRGVRTIVGDESFEVNEDKTRVMHRGRRQEVTGVVVNEGASVSRKERRELRAILHNALKHGLQSQNRGGHPRFFEHLQGRVAWVAMVHPEHGAKLRAQLEQLRAKENA